jgi:hypothetical protein
MASQALQQVVTTLANTIVNPLLAVVFAGGLLLFVYGIVEFMSGMNAEDHTKQENGKRHMLWGIVGMFVMASTWSILKIIAGTVCTAGSPESCSRILNL